MNYILSIILCIIFTISSYAKHIPSEDIEVHIGQDIEFGSIKAKMIHFGGYSTPECKLAISNDGQYFFLKKVGSTCKTLTNSKGIKIICNHNKSVCKTKSELIKFINQKNSFAIVNGLDENDDGFLAIRSSPRGKMIAKLYNGDKVEILEKKGKWYKIKKLSDNIIGWSFYKWIHEKKNITSTKSKELEIKAKTDIKPDDKSQTIEDISIYTCLNCHGKNWEKNAMNVSKVVANIRKVEDIEKALLGYKYGTYGSYLKSIMATQVRNYSDKSLKNLAKKIYIQNLPNKKTTIDQNAYIYMTESKIIAALAVYQDRGGDEEAWETLNLIGGTKPNQLLLGIIKECKYLVPYEKLDGSKGTIKEPYCKVMIGVDQFIFVRLKDMNVGVKAYGY